MATIRPFRGRRYKAAAQGRDLRDYLSPPYEQLTKEEKEALLRRSQFNIVKLEDAADRERSQPRYSRVEETAESWMKQNAFLSADEPSMYLVEEVFLHNGVSHTRRGIIVAVRLEEFYSGNIFRHENVREEWVLHKKKMMEASGHVISPLLVAYKDQNPHAVDDIVGPAAGGEPAGFATIADDHTLKLWKLTDPKKHQRLIEHMRDVKLFVADGHHRYEAAMRLRGRARAEGEIHPDMAINYLTMHLVSIDDSGLITRPFHRILRSTTVEQRLEVATR